MKEEIVSLSHPVLFVMDLYNQGAQIPEYSESTIASATPSCVSIKAVADVDGDVTVKVVEGAQEKPPIDFVRVFEGRVLTPSRKIAVVTSENRIVIETDVADVMTTIRVSVNNAEFPDHVLVEVV